MIASANAIITFDLLDGNADFPLKQKYASRILKRRQ